MSQDQQTPPPGGIVGNSQAASQGATTARVAHKKAWQDSPTLHAGIAIFMIAAGVTLITQVELNLFWKLLIGCGLIWGGKRLTATTIRAARVWGQILRGLGWIVIIYTILTSGLRLVAETGVISADNALRAVAGDSSTSPAQISGPGKAVEITPTTERQMRVVEIASLVTVNMKATRPGEQPQEVCAWVEGREELKYEPKFAMVSRGGTWVVLQFDKSTQERMLRLGVQSYRMNFETRSRGACN